MNRIVSALRAAQGARTRWPALDGIRGAAIVAVVAYHAFKLVGGWTSSKIRGDGVDWWWWPLGAGRLGVDIFFVLSGFLLWFAWHRIKARDPSPLGGLRTYGWGRAIRILPPYFVMLAVYIPLLAPELLQSAEGLWETFLFFAIQQYNEPDLPGRLNVALWTQTVEVHFYLVLPIVVLLIRRLRPLVPLVAAFALSLWWVDHRGVYPESFIVGRLVQFTAGMAVAAAITPALEAGREDASALATILRRRGAAVVLGAAAVVVALYHGQLLGLPHRSGPTVDEYVHPVLGILLAGLVAHVALSARSGGVLRAFERPIPRLVGHLSYGIYLWHFPIYDRVLEWTGGKGAGMYTGGALVGLALATALTVGVSILSYAFVERPFLERKGDKRERARDHSSARDPERRAAPGSSVSAPRTPLDPASGPSPSPGTDVAPAAGGC